VNRKRGQAVHAAETRRREVAQVQRRTSRDDNLGQLLSRCGERPLGIHRVFGIGRTVERCAQGAFIQFEAVGGIFHEQAVAQLERERRQLGEEKRFAALYPVYAHAAVCPRQNLRQRFAGGEASFLYVQLATEDARRHVGHRGSPLRQQPRRDEPQKQ
jgi:hypothetical protein